MSPQVPEDIVIVAVDEKCLAKHGGWPWSRKLQAELIEKIFESRPAVVALNILYSGEESTEDDDQFVDALRKHRDRLVVALDFEVEEGLTFEAEINELLKGQAIKNIRNPDLLSSVEAFRVNLPPAPIVGSAVFGHVYNLPDRDGKLRREILYIKYGDEYFPSFALQTALVAKGLGISIEAGEGVDLGGLWIPTDALGRIQLKYLGKVGSFKYVSVADVLSGDVPAGVFRDRIVMVGASAVGTYEPIVTIFSDDMPGVEKNATAVLNMINMDFMKRAPRSIDLLALLLFGIPALIIGHWKKPFDLIFIICLTALLLIVNQAIFNISCIQVNLIYPLSTVMGIGFFLVAYRYSDKEKKANEIRAIFSGYVPDKVIDELIKTPELASPEGERRVVTVLFSDIRGFTAFSEGHEPEVVAAMLNEYLTAMTDIVFRWEGTVDKFVGDALVAFWGAPISREDHSERAVRCALNMIKKFEELKEKWRSEGKDQLSIGIGLNTGEVLAGNIGAVGTKMDYTVIGDHVNMGARVKALTREFEADVLFTEAVFYNIKELVEQGGIGHVSIKGISNLPVKGMEKPIMICEIKSLKHDAESIVTGLEE